MQTNVGLSLIKEQIDRYELVIKRFISYALSHRCALLTVLLFCIMLFNSSL